MTANQAYQENLEQIENLIEELQAHIDINKTQFKMDNTNYQYVGDLDYVRSKIEDAIDFIA